MDLAAAHCTRGVNAHGLTEQTIVFKKIFAAISSVVGKIERIKRCGTHPTVARGESVHCARHGGEHVGGVENKTVVVVFRKRHQSASFPFGQGGCSPSGKRTAPLHSNHFKRWVICRSTACTFYRCRRGRGRCGRSSAPCEAAFSRCRRRRWRRRCRQPRARA